MPKRKSLFQKPGASEEDSDGPEGELSDEENDQDQKQKPYKKPKITFHRRKVVLFGTNLVAKKIVEILVRNECDVKIVSNQLAKSEVISKANLLWTTAFQLDLSKQKVSQLFQELLPNLLKEADIVISLLPESLEGDLIDQIIESKKNLISLNNIIQSKGLNETQVSEIAKKNQIIIHQMQIDSVLESIIANKLLNQLIQNKGNEQEVNKIQAFNSFSGVLPSPQHIPNNLGYLIYSNEQTNELEVLNQSNLSHQDASSISFALNLESYTNQKQNLSENIKNLLSKNIQINRYSLAYKGFCDKIAILQTILTCNSGNEFKGDWYQVLAKNMENVEVKYEENAWKQFLVQNGLDQPLVKKIISAATLKHPEINKIVLQQAILFLKEAKILQETSEQKLDSASSSCSLGRNLLNTLKQQESFQLHRSVSSFNQDLIISQVEIQTNQQGLSFQGKLLAQGDRNSTICGTILSNLISYSALYILQNKLKQYGIQNTQDQDFVDFLISRLQEIGVTPTFTSY